MKLYKLSLFILITVSLAACKKSSSTSDVTIDAKTMLNVAYGTDALQKMDIYLPAGRSTTSTKVMVMIHGGGWTSGDKADFAAFVDTMKTRLPDYAIFNINYRLAAGTANLFPTQENDVKAAMEFINGNATSYLISNKWVLVGASAGAHLAMLQAYKYNSPVKPKAVASFFGPSDMAEMYNNPVGGNPLLAGAIISVMGGTPTMLPALYTSSSPVNYINGSSSATILLHGGADPLVRPTQSTTVQAKLTVASVVNQYVFYPTGGHGDWDGATYKDAFNRIQAFFLANNP